MGIKTWYATPEDGMFKKGMELSATPGTGQPLALNEWEAGEVDGKTILLVDRKAEEFIGGSPLKKGGYGYFYKSEGGAIITRSAHGTVLEVTGEWLQKGARTNFGTIVQMGDAIAVVDDGRGNHKTIFKGSLRPYVDLAILNAVKRAEHTGRLPKLSALKESNAGAPQSVMALAGLMDDQDELYVVRNNSRDKTVPPKMIYAQSEGKKYLASEQDFNDFTVKGKSHGEKFRQDFGESLSAGTDAPRRFANCLEEMPGQCYCQTSRTRRSQAFKRNWKKMPV